MEKRLVSIILTMTILLTVFPTVLTTAQAAGGQALVIAADGNVTYGGGDASTYTSAKFAAINKGGDFGDSVTAIQTPDAVGDDVKGIETTGVDAVTITSMPGGIDIRSNYSIYAIHQGSLSKNASSSVFLQGIGNININVIGNANGGAAFKLGQSQNCDINQNQFHVEAASLSLETSDGFASCIEGQLGGRKTYIDITGDVQINSKDDYPAQVLHYSSSDYCSGEAVLKLGTVTVSAPKYTAYGFWYGGLLNAQVILNGNMNITAKDSATGFYLYGSSSFDVGGKDITVNNNINSAEGTEIWQNASLTLTADNFSVSSASGDAYGLATADNATCTATISNLTASSDKSNALGVYTNGNSVCTATIGTLTASSNQGNAYGIYQNYGGTTTLNNSTITANGTTGSYAVYVENGDSKISTVNLNNVTIKNPIVLSDAGGYPAVLNLNGLSMAWNTPIIAGSTSTVTSSGAIYVDMTGATETEIQLIHYEGSGDLKAVYDTCQFEAGKDESYKFVVSGTDLYARKVPVTVSFNSMGGTVVATQTDMKGKKVTRPADPTRADSIFAGWYLNGTEYDFNTTVNTPITLTARWILNKGNSETEIPTENDRNNTHTKIQVTGDTGVQASGLESIATVIKASNQTVDVKVVLNAEKKEENAVSPTDVTAIKTVTAEKTVEFLSIDLTKYIGSNAGEKITEASDVIEVLIPFDTSGKNTASLNVYRHHNHSVEVFTEIPAGSNGTDLQYYLENDVLHLFTKKFSTYAVAYQPISGGNNGNNGNTASSGGDYYTPDGYTITSDHSTITKVTVDGKTIDSRNYTVSGGNVVLTQTYLDTLSSGRHTVKLYNGDKVSTTTITIQNRMVVRSSKTGDIGVLLYAGMAVSALLGSGYVVRSKEKYFM